jgi:hypothetical protein
MDRFNVRAVADGSTLVSVEVVYDCPRFATCQQTQRRLVENQLPQFWGVVSGGFLDPI